MKLTENVKVSAIVLAAGCGSRMDSGITKQRIEILGRPMLAYTLDAFEGAETVSFITVVTRADEVVFVSSLCKNLKKPYRIVIGGNSRAESARLGFESLSDDAELVAIHDAARCLITPAAIDRVAECAALYGCASAVMNNYDTLKLVDSEGYIVSTEDRSQIKRAATPQIFKKSIYKRALSVASLPDEQITDDNMLVQSIGERIKCVDVGDDNVKITRKNDLLIAEGILRKRAEGKSNKTMEIRIGHGYDVHKLIEGRRLIIGGVEIPYEKGLLGHSDADVLVHVIMDAILGAAALGDIGKHFPDTAAEFKDACSLNLLIRVKKLVAEKGYKVSNIDATLVLQAPKISPYIEKMRDNIAFALDISRETVNIKATTEEKLGFTGSGDGVAAHAVVLLKT